MSNSKIWEEIHLSDSDGISYETRFPSSQFLAFCDYHVKNYLSTQMVGTTSWLEYGSGSGAAATYASKCFKSIEHFHLLDVSEAALKKSENSLRQAREGYANYTALHLLVGDNRGLAIDSGTIDIVNAESSLYYNSHKSFQVALEEIHRVMKPDGIGRFYIKSDEDRYCKAEYKIAEMTYMIDSPGHWENGMTICCMPYKCVMEDFRMFSTLIIGKEAMNYTGINEMKSFWVVTATK